MAIRPGAKITAQLTGRVSGVSTAEATPLPPFPGQQTGHQGLLRHTTTSHQELPRHHSLLRQRPTHQELPRHQRRQGHLTCDGRPGDRQLRQAGRREPAVEQPGGLDRIPGLPGELALLLNYWQPATAFKAHTRVRQLPAPLPPARFVVSCW